MNKMTETKECESCKCVSPTDVYSSISPDTSIYKYIALGGFSVLLVVICCYLAGGHKKKNKRKR